MWTLAKSVQAYVNASPDRALRLVLVGTALLFVGSCSVSFYVITTIQADIPYGEESRPKIYRVLHKGENGHWGLAVLDGAGTYANPAALDLPVLDWPEVESVESFVVSPEDLVAINRIIGVYGQHRGRLTQVEVTSSEHEGGQQEIAIKTRWGDNSRFYRYIVDSEKGEIIPIAYGMLEKRQLASAIMIAFAVSVGAAFAATSVYVIHALKLRLHRGRASSRG